MLCSIENKEKQGVILSSRRHLVFLCIFIIGELCLPYYRDDIRFSSGIISGLLYPGDKFASKSESIGFNELSRWRKLVFCVKQLECRDM